MLGLILPVISILFGILVIMLPKFLRFIVGGYFILSGLLLLLSAYGVL